MSKQDPRDDGFGLTEVMISMLLLALAMMAMISLLITAVNANAKNATRNTASQYATDRIEDVRFAAQSGDCYNVIAVASQVQEFEDGRKTPLVMEGTAACTQASPAHENPTLAQIVVTVKSPDGAQEYARIATDIYVKFAGSGDPS